MAPIIGNHAHNRFLADAALIGLAVCLTATAPVAKASPVLVNSFDASPPAWRLAQGSGSVFASTTVTKWPWMSPGDEVRTSAA